MATLRSSNGFIILVTEDARPRLFTSIEDAIDTANEMDLTLTSTLNLL